jgi:uncharacterized protein with PQ loop repeat
MLLSTLLTANIILSVLHSIKHVPQCIHMIQNNSADGVSLCYIHGEMGLNILSVFTTFKMYVTLHNPTYLLPILLEKSFSFTMIVVMLHLKKKYSIEEDDDCGDTWKDVESDYHDDTWKDVDYDDNSLEIV